MTTLAILAVGAALKSKAIPSEIPVSFTAATSSQSRSDTLEDTLASLAFVGGAAGLSGTSGNVSPGIGAVVPESEACWILPVGLTFCLRRRKVSRD